MVASNMAAFGNSHFGEFEQVKGFSSDFADFEQVKIVNGHFTNFEQQQVYSFFGYYLKTKTLNHY